MSRPLVLRRFGQRPYRETWQAMQALTDHRDDTTADELWLLEHPPVFTQGRNAAPEHLLDPGDIPVIAIDRGGQVTYHGPGQVILYTLIDIRRRGLGVRALVDAMEGAVQDLLADYGLVGELRREAPGVYVHGAKVAALGLRVRRGCAYHGLALNVDMDLSPFDRINPCGYRGQPVTDLTRLLGPVDSEEVGEHLATLLAERLGSALTFQAPGETHVPAP